MPPPDRWDSIWNSYRLKFPELGAQWGEAPPREADGSPLKNAVDHALRLKRGAETIPSPTAPAPTSPTAPSPTAPTAVADPAIVTATPTPIEGDHTGFSGFLKNLVYGGRPVGSVRTDDPTFFGPRWEMPDKKPPSEFYNVPSEHYDSFAGWLKGKLTDTIEYPEEGPILDAEGNPVLTREEFEKAYPKDHPLRTFHQKRLGGIPYLGQEALPPEPGRETGEGLWKKRASDFAKMAGQLGRLEFWGDDVSKRIEEAKAAGTSTKAARFAPALKGLEAIEQTSMPAFGILAYIFNEPGVRKRFHQIRKTTDPATGKGWGILEAMQAAVNQSMEAGEIPFIPATVGRLVTAPEEFIPGVGIWGTATKTVKQLTTTAVKTGVKGVTKEAPEVVAKDIQEKLAKTPGRTVVDLEGIDKPIVVSKEVAEEAIEQAVKSADEAATTVPISSLSPDARRARISRMATDRKKLINAGQEPPPIDTSGMTLDEIDFVMDKPPKPVFPEVQQPLPSPADQPVITRYPQSPVSEIDQQYISSISDEMQQALPFPDVQPGFGQAPLEEGTQLRLGGQPEIWPSTVFPKVEDIPASELLRRQKEQAQRSAEEWIETPEVFKRERTGLPDPLQEMERQQAVITTGRKRNIGNLKKLNASEKKAFEHAWRQMEPDKDVQTVLDSFDTHRSIGSDVRRANPDDVDGFIEASDEARNLIDDLLAQRERGEITERYTNLFPKDLKKNTKRAAELIYGDTSRDSVFKLNRYLDRKSQYKLNLRWDTYEQPGMEFNFFDDVANRTPEQKMADIEEFFEDTWASAKLKNLKQFGQKLREEIPYLTEDLDPLPLENIGTRWDYKTGKMVPDFGRWKRRPDGGTPSSASQAGHRGRKIESDIAKRAEQKTGYIPGEPVDILLDSPAYTNFLDRGGDLSQWVKDLDFGISSRWIVNKTLGTLKDMATKDELTQMRGFALKKQWPKLASQLYKAALRRYAGQGRLHDMQVEKVIENGQEELRALGWIDEDNVPVDWALGTVARQGETTLDNPGPLRMLYYALDDPEEWLPKLIEKHGDAAEKQYWNLKTLAKWEEMRTIERGTLPETVTQEDYFYRGVVPDPANLEVTSLDRYYNSTIRSRMADHKRNVGLGKTQSYQMKRKDYTLKELMEFGFKPARWNPYEQAMLRQRMGFQTRMQTQIIDLLKDPALGMAKLVRSESERLQLDADGWVEVRGAGPAFSEDSVIAVSKKFAQGESVTDDVNNPLMEGLTLESHFGIKAVPEEIRKSAGVLEDLPRINAQEQGDLIKPEWMFPKPVANSLKEMFGQQPGWTKRMSEGGAFKPDNFIFIPKRAKLFGTLFQQVDFAHRTGIGTFHGAFERIYDASGRLAKGQIGPAEYTRALGDSLVDVLYRLPKSLTNTVRANLSKGYRQALRDRLMSDEVIMADMPDITWGRMVENGLHVKDTTILNIDDSIKSMEATARKKGLVGKSRKVLSNIEKWMRDGLFDGVYPSAIMHDVQYNLLPMLRRMHPDLNSEQLMGTAAKLANIKWSTIPVEQSVFQGGARDAFERLAFSLNELETGGRLITGALHGPNKRFFAGYWAAVYGYSAFVSTLIGMTTTALTRKGDQGELVYDIDLTRARPPAFKTYVNPYNFSGWNSLFYGYDNTFLSPKLPIPTRAGDHARLDVLGQMDTFLRLSDGQNAYPLASFISGRIGTMPRAIWNQIKGEDYMGREVDKYGYSQRLLQFVYDALAPIGAGQAALSVGREVFKNRDMPHLSARPGKWGMVIGPDATFEDITPSVEAKLGWIGVWVQSLGFNLIAPTSEELWDEMTKRTFGEGTDGFEGVHLNSIKDVDKHPYKELLRKTIMNDPLNKRYVREIGERQREGAIAWYDNYSKMLEERRKLSRKRLENETILVSKHVDRRLGWNQERQEYIRLDGVSEAWSPSSWKADRNVLRTRSAAQYEAIEKIYGDDPRVRENLKRWEDRNPSRSSEPLEYAIFMYGKIKERHSDPTTGKVDDWRAYKADWEREQASWDAGVEADDRGELLEMFNAWFEQGEHHPFYDKYYRDRKKIDESGYWQEGPKQEGDLFDRQIKMLDAQYGSGGHDVLPVAPQGVSQSLHVWDSYLKAPIEEKRQMKAHVNFAIPAVIKTMEKLRSIHRHTVATTNPEVDRLIVFWNGSSPYSQSNVEYYYNLYGKWPKLRR